MSRLVCGDSLGDAARSALVWWRGRGDLVLPWLRTCNGMLVLLAGVGVLVMVGRLRPRNNGASALAFYQQQGGHFRNSRCESREYAGPGRTTSLCTSIAVVVVLCARSSCGLRPRER